MLRHLILALVLAARTLSLPATAQAQTCPANTPHLTGTWATLPYLMPINPISATMLRNGKILIVSGSENDASNDGAEAYRAAVWDPTTGTIDVDQLKYDVFCSGVAVLPDGRPLVVGGTSDYTFTGDRRASIFDPATGGFLQSQDMADGRWYATATVLGDGRILAFSGLKSAGGTNRTVEIYDLANAGPGWGTPTGNSPFTPPLYPHLALLPSGKVFFTGQGGGGQTANSWLFDPVLKTWGSSASTGNVDRHYGSFALLPLLPPSYTPKVMEFGGGNPGKNTTQIIDMSAATPAWASGPNMSTGRIQLNATILPNGRILAAGGSSSNEVPDTAGKTADVYDPVGNTFSSGGTAVYSRLYHSVALLLPDATVASTGSNPGSRGSYQPAIEIWTPPYLFDANDQLITAARPAITGITPASKQIGYGASFTVNYTSTSAIAWAVLIRPGSATHGLDMDQRLVGLCGPSPQPACAPGGGTLALTAPPNGNVAPPGYYMLFLLDSAGVPSRAEFVQLYRFATPPPTGTIDSPVGMPTINAGGTVFFSTSTVVNKYSWIFPGGTPATSTLQNPGNVTFNAPGDYITSLTVVDVNGNTDPSPPTREVCVDPTTADFTIAVSPSSRTVLPGQSATFTVTVTPYTGFAGSVALTVGSESGFGTGITSGGFSPATIVGGGTATLTMNTTTSALPYALSLTVKGVSGTLTRFAPTTLMVNLAAPVSLTATPGNTQVALSWPAVPGATGYHVKRGTVSGGPYLTVACPTTTSYTNTGLTNGQTYRYVVSASFTGGPDSGGESADSPEASATPNPPLPTTTTSSSTTSTSTSSSSSSTSTSTTSTSSTSSSTTTSSSTSTTSTSTSTTSTSSTSSSTSTTETTSTSTSTSTSSSTSTTSTSTSTTSTTSTSSSTSTTSTSSTSSSTSTTSTSSTSSSTSTTETTSTRTSTSTSTSTTSATSTSSTTTSSTTVAPTTSSTTSSTSTSTSTSTTLPAGNCGAPIVVPPEGGTFVGTTTGASAQAGTCASTNTAPEAVFQWTPSTSGVATIETCNSSTTTFDTVLYVRSAACVGGPELSCNDDSAGCGISPDGGTPRRGSRVRPTVTAGQTYYLVVDGYAGGQGAFSLTVTPPAGSGPTTTVTTSTSTTVPTTTSTTVTTTTSTTIPTTTSTTVTTTTSTSTTSSTLPGSPCAGQVVIPPEGGSFVGTTAGASGQAGTCAPTNTAPEAVFQWTPSTSGVATIETCNSSTTTFDTVLYVRSAACTSGPELSCNDDTAGCGISPDGGTPRRGSRVRPTVTAGQTYYLVVDGYAGAQGAFSLTVAPPP